MKANIQPSNGHCKTSSKSIPKTQFIGSNFDFLYDSFHQPLANAIANDGEMIGLTKEGELKPFEHTKISKEVENDLAEYAKKKNSSMLEVKITSYYKIHKDELTEPLKYILSFYKGVLEYLKGSYDQAEKDYQLCFNLYDGDPQLYYNLGLTYMMLRVKCRKKQYYKSVLMFEWCTILDPYHPYATNNLAYVCILLKKNKEASEACSGAYAVNSNCHNHFRNWAIALLNQKMYGEAVEVIRYLIDLEPSTSSSFGATVENWVVWAEIMKSKGEFETAKKMYERALELNEEDAYSRNELAKLNAITDPKIEEEVERVITKLAEQRNKLSSGKRRSDVT